MNYEEAVAYIEETPKFTTKNKLEHTKECLRRLGNPQKQFQVVHVAGTNGKGSTCAFLTSVFREAGYSCGLFTSPHLVVINERFQINEKNIDNDTFLRAFEKVKKLADELVAEGSYHPTYFEFLFLMGMVIFADANVDYVILETGLGGRLDATTAVEEPSACVITSISFDHMQYLGNTIEAIAGEKAGIIVPGVPVIYGQDKLDEISMSAPTSVCEIKDGWFQSYEITPEQFGYERCSKDDLVGGTPAENAEITKKILKGEERGPKRQAVCLNAGAALYIAGKAESIEKGVRMAEELIDSGAALRKLEEFITCSNA